MYTVLHNRGVIRVRVWGYIYAFLYGVGHMII